MNDMSNAAESTRTLTLGRAVREAVHYEFEHNPDVFMMGQDIFKMGGIFGTAEGLGEKYGRSRVIDTPISETAVVGAAAGAAMAGLRPIVDFAYVDFIGVCFNAIANYASKTHYMSAGQFKMPMVLLVSTGGGYANAAQHSQSLHATIAHMPGIKVVCPTNAYDAKGMMHTALRGDDFVVFLSSIATVGMMMLGSPIPATMSEVPKDDYEIPFGKARTYREGKDVTLVGTGVSVHHCMEVAAELEKEGVDAEVIDPRSLVPLDRDAIFESVKKTGRLVAVDEDYLSYGIGSEILASVVERDPGVLKSAPVRLGCPDIPIPFAKPLEDHILPGPHHIMDAARKVLA